MSELQADNLILAGIPADEMERIQHLLEPYPLRLREKLHEPGEEFEWVYFPRQGIISILTVLENGMMIEFATVGREGSTGVPLMVELEYVPMALVSQMPGLAMRMRKRDFVTELERSPGFAAAMNRYAGVLFALLAQSAACNRAHQVDQRCARWLLMTHDQAGSNEFPMTQEFLSQMLGVSRSSVAASAGALQKAGLIGYRRGQVWVLDRQGLESAACECYGVVARQYERLKRRTDSIPQFA